MSEGRYRICFLIDSLGMGGAERMLYTLISNLDHDRLDIRVAYFSEREASPMKTRIEELNIAVDYVPITRMSQPSALPRLMRYLRQNRFDLVHTQLVTAIVLGSMASKWLGIPSVATLHTLDAPPPGTRTEKRRLLMWWALRRFADRVIAVSEQTRRHHVQAGGLPPDKLLLLYNGVDCARFQVQVKQWRAAVRRELGIAAHAPLLMTVAVLREPKGIQHMVAAMPRIVAREPETRYVVVGGGPYASELQTRVQQSPAVDAIRLIGPRDDIPELLSAADIFVHPTLDDALPTVLAEAMAAGKAIIASDVGGVPEMIQDGTNGILISPGDVAALEDACLTLISNTTLQQRMGVQSRAIAERKFNVNHQVAELDSLYMHLIEGSPNG